MTEPTKFLNPEAVTIRSGKIYVEMCRDDDGFDFVEPADYYDVEVILTKKEVVFDPGYFIDMSMNDETRREYFGDTPRTVDWFDEEPYGSGDVWVRVNVTDRNF